MAELIKKIRTASGDLQIDYNSLANLPSLNTNLLINSNFKSPINQRNATSYTVASGNTSRVYGIDRWWIKGAGAAMTVQSGYVGVSLPSGCDFGQALEIDYKSYDNMTVSVKLKGDSAVKSATISGLSSKSASTETFVNLTSTVKVGFFVFGHGMYMYLRPISSAVTLNIEWIKLESGSAATPFMPRLKSEEVILCKRFYQVITIRNSDVVCSLYKRQENTYGGLMYFESMYRIPTVTKAGEFYVEQYNTSGAYATFSDKITSIEIVPQWSALKFNITLSTVDPVNHLGTSSESIVFRLDAEYD